MPEPNKAEWEGAAMDESRREVVQVWAGQREVVQVRAGQGRHARTHAGLSAPPAAACGVAAQSAERTRGRSREGTGVQWWGTYPRGTEDS